MSVILERMKKIILSKGKYALVDDEDFEFLSQWKWCCDSRGYAVRSEKMTIVGSSNRPLVRMQRVILDAPNDKLVDHINGDTLDNRKHNLRLATKSENMRNRKMAKNCKSGFKGVWFNKKRQRWIAYIKTNGQSRVLGHFKDRLEAAHVYNQVAEQLFGEFARLNDV